MADESDVAELLALSLEHAGSTEAVAQVVTAAARLLDGCVACSVTQLTARGGAAFRTPAASNLLGVTLDRAQYAAGDGPCVQACRDGRTHVFSVTDERHAFPALAAEARRHGVRSSLSVPVPGAAVPAALNLYSASWPDSELPGQVAAVAAFVARCAAPVLGAPARPTLPSGTEGRRHLVHAAQQALGSPPGDETAAFGVLVRRSRTEHRSIFAVARDVLAAADARDTA